MSIKQRTREATGELHDSAEEVREGAANAAAMGRLAAENRGQAGSQNLVGLFIGLMIASIVAIEVFIPVVLDASANSNVSGTTGRILELLPLFAVLLLLIALAGPVMGRVRQ